MTNLLPDLLRDRGLRMSDLARKLSLNKSTITRWSQRTIPATRAVDIERETGIPRAQLRPDLFGDSK